MTNVRTLHLKGGWGYKIQGQNLNAFGKATCNYPEEHS